MSQRTQDPAISRGYSLPTSMHERIAEMAAKREISASQLVRRAVNYYLREILSETEKKVS